MTYLADKKISIVIPSHNEEKNISYLIEQLRETLSPTGYSYELIFVDDGSRDNTLNELKINAELHSNVFM
jgi:glycosyltransferase involved in cell wall biosynthesis